MSSRVVFLISGVFAVTALVAGLCGIWAEDVRWWNTCGALSVVTGATAFVGIMIAIREDFS